MLDMAISCGLLCDFIENLYEVEQHEKVWSIWLHKDTGKSWEDFKLMVIPQEVDVKEVISAEETIENILANGG